MSNNRIDNNAYIIAQMLSEKVNRFEEIKEEAWLLYNDISSMGKPVQKLFMYKVNEQLKLIQNGKESTRKSTAH